MNHFKIRAAILDVDGTLVDSNHAHAEAWRLALSEAGFEIPYEKIRVLVGMGGDKVLPTLVGSRVDEERGDEIRSRRGEIFRAQFLAKIQPFPRVRELLLRMKEEGIRLAVATSGNRKDLEPLLKIANIADLMDETLTSDDAEKSKPDPDILRAAQEKLKVSPDEALMLGDTPYDVEAARRLGMRTVALRSGGWDDEGLHAALEIYEDAEDLWRNFQTSSFCHATAVPPRDEADTPPVG